MEVSRVVRQSALFLSWFACASAAWAVPPLASEQKEGLEIFEKKIRPVLVAKCYECHSTESKVKGGLVVDSREGLRNGGESGAAVVPGSPKDSLLLEALRHEGLEMPPKEKLPDAIVADFARWIELGAPDPRESSSKAIRRDINIDEGRQHWAYQPPQAVPAPKTRNTAWPKSDLDRFILARLEAEQLQPVAAADKTTLLRRVSLDLTGLPPTPKDIATFLADDSPQAFERVVDRLLASPQFGERWGRHWLDVARYGESTGKERNVPYQHAWRYRDWVIDALNADKPYDQFVREQVAGDLLPAKTVTARNDNLVATGFLALGPKGLNERNAEQYRMDVVDEQIDVVTRSILATTTSCARCHDHKFDPIPTNDYYALAGIFKSTEVYSGVTRGTRTVVDKQLLVMQPELSNQIPAAARVKISALSEKLAAARAELQAIENPDPQAAKKLAKKQALKAAKKKGKKNAQADVVADKGPTKAEVQQRIAEFEKELKQLGHDGDESLLAMAAQEGKPVDCRVCVRGEVTDLGPSVPRGFLSVLKSPRDPQIDAAHSGRLELAQWLTSNNNPLTARVMVNRVWAHLFGQGIVPTVDDFGALGEKPTHPELLDHLAVQFMHHGWSTKRLVRTIVLSRTYQMSSDHHDGNYAKDPANRFIWRASRRRLDAEAIRDAVLAATGELDLKRPEGSPTAQLAAGEIGRGVNLEPLRRPQVCRSVYLPSVRGVTPEMLTVFDVADSSLVVGQREVTTVATQALYMMNSPFVLQQSELLAKSLLVQPDEQKRVTEAYLRILGREPTPAERDQANAFLRELSSNGSDAAHLDAWASFCQTLYATAEFRYVY